LRTCLFADLMDEAIGRVLFLKALRHAI
jgi:hypothetical protein